MNSLHRYCVPLRFEEGAKHGHALELEQVVSVVEFVHFQAGVQEGEGVAVLLHDECDLAQVLDGKDRSRLGEGVLE